MTDKTAKRILLLVPSIALFLAGRVGHGLVSSVFALFEFAAFWELVINPLNTGEPPENGYAFYLVIMLIIHYMLVLHSLAVTNWMRGKPTIKTVLVTPPVALFQASRNRNGVISSFFTFFEILFLTNLSDLFFTVLVVHALLVSHALFATRGRRQPYQFDYRTLSTKLNTYRLAVLNQFNKQGKPTIASEPQLVNNDSISSPKNIFEYDASGWTPLHYAAWRNDAETATQLVENDALVDAVDRVGETPLHIAARFDAVEASAILISGKADIDAQDKIEGRTPLHLAVHAGGVLSDKDDRSTPPQFGGPYALKMFHSLCSAGARIDIQEFGGLTLLHSAACGGSLEICERLVLLGLNVEDRDYGERTPLHWACRFGNFSVVLYLIENGAEIDLKDHWGKTPLTIASENRELQIVETLLISGADKSGVELSWIDGQENN